MSIEATLIETARAAPRHIVLPEGEDPRIVSGAVRAVADGIATVTLIGNSQKVEEAALAAGQKRGDLERQGITLVDPAWTDVSAFLETLLSVRHGKVTPELAAELVRDPLVYGALMVRRGEADGFLAGAVNTTAHTVRTALQMIGKAVDADLVSSFFLMELPTGRIHTGKADAPELVIFADCGLVVDPCSAELAGIAIASAQSYRALTGGEPHVAMLSFSTRGSASHKRVEKVTSALEMIRKQAPDLIVDGELQFDAAFHHEVGTSKAPGSVVAGKANVFVFPNLDAGNIGYKIAQRIGGAVALGPALQGLARPANDLSRGCTAKDVFQMIALTVCQARFAG